MNISEYKNPTSSNLSFQEIELLTISFAKNFNIEVGTDLKPVISNLGGRLQPESARTSLMKKANINMLIHEKASFDIYLGTTEFFANNERLFLASRIGYYIIHFLIANKLQEQNLEPLKILDQNSPTTEIEAKLFALSLLVPRKNLMERPENEKDNLKRLSLLYGIEGNMIQIIKGVYELKKEEIQSRKIEAFASNYFGKQSLNKNKKPPPTESVLLENQL